MADTARIMTAAPPSLSGPSGAPSPDPGRWYPLVPARCPKRNAGAPVGPHLTAAAAAASR